ncbi:MAG: hypothetical protein KDC38_01160 [Planctomycetes bacterium]|nr:hypothetical protein [Planctomycetota bacterium]
MRHLRAARLEARIYEETHPRRLARVGELKDALVEAARGDRTVIAISGDDLMVNHQVVEDLVSTELVVLLRERMIRQMVIGTAVSDEEIELVLRILTETAELPQAEGQRFDSDHLSIEYFDGLLDLDASGNRRADPNLDPAWAAFTPEQVAAIRLVTADDRVQNKLRRFEGVEQDQGPESVDFIHKFFELLASDAGAEWGNAEKLTGTLLAGLDLVHEAQQVQRSRGEIPRQLLDASSGIGSNLQARFRWKLLGSMFGAAEQSPRTAEDIPLPSAGPQIDLTGLEEIDPGPFPTELGEVMLGHFSPAIELEHHLRTLLALHEVEHEDVTTEGWDESLVRLVNRRQDLAPVARAVAGRVLVDEGLAEFFQSHLVHPDFLGHCPPDLAVDLCTSGRQSELQRLFELDPRCAFPFVDPESGASPPEPLSPRSFEVLRSIIALGDLRALDVAYALLLRFDGADRWSGEWGMWLIGKILGYRAASSWIKGKVRSVLDPDQFPLLFALPEEVTADLKESITDLDESTLLRFFSALSNSPDRCPLGYLVAATRHSAVSVRCVALRCLSHRTDAASVGILFHRLQMCGSGEADTEELQYVFDGLERRTDVDVCPRLEEIVNSRVGWRKVWPKEMRDRAKTALRRIKRARRGRG